MRTAESRFLAGLPIYKSATEPAGGRVRTRTRNRRARSGRVLPDRIHQCEGAGPRRRDCILRRDSLCAGVTLWDRNVMRRRGSNWVQGASELSDVASWLQDI